MAEAPWKLHRPSLDTLPLSDKDSALAEEEAKEIISFLPDLKGKRILELGACIGRFTLPLAQSASRVTALDFSRDQLNYNEDNNRHLPNISFLCDHATTVDFPNSSFDLVVSNWVFSYLHDGEMKELLKKILRWLSPKGQLFLRECCCEPSGDTKSIMHPKHYRSFLKYCEGIRESRSADGAAFKIVRGKSLKAFLKHASDPNQMCLLLEKWASPPGSNESFQHLQTLYDINNILLSERMYGHMWFSPGGESENRDLCVRLPLRLNHRVLDVGCGTGGNAFFMARHYGANVHGIDLSTYMINIAIERQNNLEANIRKKVQFEYNNILEADIPPSTFDLIYSRDVFLHINNKVLLFQKLYKWLKPGGTLFFTDFCRGAGPDDKDFLDHVGMKGYTLVPETSHCQVLKEVGFKDIESEDKKQDFIRVLQSELKSFVSAREAIVNDFSEEGFKNHIQSWEDKTKFAECNQLTWVSFLARK